MSRIRSIAGLALAIAGKPKPCVDLVPVSATLRWRVFGSDAVEWSLSRQWLAGASGIALHVVAERLDLRRFGPRPGRVRGPERATFLPAVLPGHLDLLGQLRGVPVGRVVAHRALSSSRVVWGVRTDKSPSQGGAAALPPEGSARPSKTAAPQTPGHAVRVSHPGSRSCGCQQGQQRSRPTTMSTWAR